MGERDQPVVSEAQPVIVSRAAPAARVAGMNTLAGVVIGVAAVAALSIGRDVLIPIVLAVLLSFVLSPLMALLRRLWIGRVAAAVLAVVLAIVIMIGVSTVIGTQVAAVVARAPLYQTTIGAKVEGLQTAVSNVLNGRVRALIKRIESLGAPTGPAPAPSEAETTPAPTLTPGQRTPVPVIITQANASSTLQLGQRILMPIVRPLVTLAIVLVVAVFILLQKDDLRDRVIRVLGAGDLFRATAAMNEAGRRLSRYFLTQLAVNCGFGTVVGAGLFLIGVPSPVLWGAMAAMLRFVPYIGSYLAAVLPVLLAAAVGHGWEKAIETAILFIATEVIIANVVEPMVYSRTTGLSPIAVVVAAIFWTWLWGPIGLIMSTPITLCLVVLGRHIESLAFLDVLLGEGPALTPMETFYQRLLAGDPDEAEEAKERFLEHQQHTLAEYYDTVIREGLRIASRDAGRGVLTTDQIMRIRRTAMEVLQPPGTDATRPAEVAEGDRAGRTRAVVLCIAGRGPFDEVATEMLAVLLQRRGITARVVSNEAVSRARIGELDAHNVAMAALLSFDLAGTPTALRPLLRRLRERLDGAPILLGLWPTGDTLLSDAGGQQALGVAWCASSFDEAREAAIVAVQRVAEESIADAEAVESAEKV
ncbi:MAG: AI-2E family transporter [Acetobacteraceae bacterium]